MPMTPAASFPTTANTVTRRKPPIRGKGMKNIDVPRKNRKKNVRVWKRLVSPAALVKAKRKGGQKFSPVKSPIVAGSMNGHHVLIFTSRLPTRSAGQTAPTLKKP